MQFHFFVILFFKYFDYFPQPQGVVVEGGVCHESTKEI